VDGTFLDDTCLSQYGSKFTNYHESVEKHLARMTLDKYASLPFFFFFFFFF